MSGAATAAAADRGRWVALADAGDSLADALVEPLAAALAGEKGWRLLRLGAGDPPPVEDPVGEGADLGGDAEALILLPRRAPGRRRPNGELGPADRALIERARRWAVGGGRRPSTGGPGSTPRLVLVSSALIHPPSHRHRGFIAEADHSRRPPADRVARRWRRLEAEVARAVRAADTVAVVLRPTPVGEVGVGGDDVFGRLFTGRFGIRLALVPAGFDPPLQLLSVGELVDAIAAAIAGELPPGAWHVAPEGVVPLSRALRQAGVRRLPVPTAGLRLLARLGGREPDEIEALRYPVTVGDAARRRAMAPRRPALPSATLERRGGELAHDPFGLDGEYVARLGHTLFRFLHDTWWRIEWRGLERVPRQGGAVLVGNHRGHQPWDGVMILHRLAADLGRHPRFLIHPALVKFPFLAPFLIRCGGVHACRENGDWVLGQGELLGVFPEGIRGAFRRYRDAHRLVPFRPDYVRFALRHQVPIVPLVIVGSAEIFPILGKLDWRWWKRVSGWPTLPVTPTLSLLPLPSKWHVQVLEPLEPWRDHGPGAADDTEVVRRINREVERRMAAELAAMLARRRSLFHGSTFDREDDHLRL